ncbi:MAG: amidase family protein [Alphaproteobacteria bacterium]
MDDLIGFTAREAVTALKQGDVSPLELVNAAAARIEVVDGAVNALPTLCLERAREHAHRLMARERAARGPLAGLPLAVKDLVDVAGVRTTYGSPIYADHVPERSDVMVETLEARGGIVLAKSNTPEFGAGANTFNEVFGKTLNPWDVRLTCGGSSGGSAVALATGEVWLATGSDLGGSLRTPASFCAVVGFRPGPGRVATGPGPLPFDDLAVEGPMARTVGDVALMFDAMTGAHGEDPRSIPAPEQPFMDAVDAPAAPGRVAFSRDLGITPVDAEVATICEQAAQRFADFGAAVEAACPDFSGAVETFQTLRAARFVAGRAPLLGEHRDKLKPDVIWNIEKGLALSADDIGAAARARGALFHRVARFFRNYDLLLCPAAIVPPFDVNERYVSALGGVEFDNYVDWLAITFAITLTSCPSLCVPCGFTANGLPVGLQIVGPPRGEAGVLAAGALFEEAAGLSHELPIDPR